MKCLICGRYLYINNIRQWSNIYSMRIKGDANINFFTVCPNCEKTSLNDIHKYIYMYPERINVRG